MTSGRLDIVATPIGNLGDLSPRAQAALAAATLIAAEDTRRTGQLLSTLGLSRPMLSLHEHNEHGRIAAVLERLGRGETVALVSDAGTPLLSDPGEQLVAAVIEAGFEVRSVPGPTALAAALAVAGLPTQRFCFEGFLPPRAGARRERLAELAHEPRTLVFFEAPHRIAETLADLRAAFGAGRRACVARELTKLHETHYRGTLEALATLATTDADLARGEITLVVQGAPAPDGGAADAPGTAQALDRALRALLGELPLSRAAAVAAKLVGCPRQQAYQRARELAGDDSD